MLQVWDGSSGRLLGECTTDGWSTERLAQVLSMLTFLSSNISLFVSWISPRNDWILCQIQLWISSAYDTRGRWSANHRTRFTRVSAEGPRLDSAHYNQSFWSFIAWSSIAQEPNKPWGALFVGVVEEIFRIGSMTPGAILNEASREFEVFPSVCIHSEKYLFFYNKLCSFDDTCQIWLQRSSQRADEYIRIVKDDLDKAVEQCIEAAGHEWEPSVQKKLLRVSWGSSLDLVMDGSINVSSRNVQLKSVQFHKNWASF